MLDQDVPPVEEGEAGGVADVVPEAGLRAEAGGRGGINSRVASTPLPWTTVTARQWAVGTTAHVRDAAGRDSRKLIRSPSLSHCRRCAKTRTPASLPLLTIFSFKRKFRRPLAS